MLEALENTVTQQFAMAASDNRHTHRMLAELLSLAKQQNNDDGRANLIRKQ
jgi:hypothetical protein